jgi:HAD superfamily phosphoserine phosphatase-like hydrolase
MFSRSCDFVPCAILALAALPMPQATCGTPLGLTIVDDLHRHPHGRRAPLPHLSGAVNVPRCTSTVTFRVARPNPGERLVRACQAAGLKTLLVSGGFTFFTDRIRDRLGIDYTRSNVLEIESGPNCGQLTGRMVDQPWGDICDGAEKRRMFLQTCEQLGIRPQQAIAMGDGANDLPMMGEAGLSVAYHAKPKVREQAMVQINEGGLDRLLEVVR